ncbi:MAG TPA: protein kinase, partial [Chthonomonadaceae bacterium]|nr:protein kinase [Chthonomonadaceae bacterium]
EEAAGILEQVAAGVDAVHRQGWLHRDIKPSNVMLLYNGQAKLLDFGVARAAGETSMTQAGSLIGSPAYLAPEQLGDGPVTPAADIWALGVLLYEMLAGRPPFHSETVSGVLYKIAHTPPDPLPGAPPGVRTVLRRALAKDPARRYPSARTLSEAFAAALKAKPALMPASRVPPPPFAVVEKTLRFAAPPVASSRERRSLAAAGLLGLAGLAGLAWALMRPASVPTAQTLPPRVVLNPAPARRVAEPARRPAPSVPRMALLPTGPLATASRLPASRRPRPRAIAPMVLAENSGGRSQNQSAFTDRSLPAILSAAPERPEKATAARPTPAPSLPPDRPVPSQRPHFYRRSPEMSEAFQHRQKTADMARQALSLPADDSRSESSQSPVPTPAPTPRQSASAARPEPPPQSDRPAEDAAPARRAPSRTWRYQEHTEEAAAAPAEPPAAPAESGRREGTETDAGDNAPGDPDAARVELTRLLHRWIAATNTRDMDAQMRFYARHLSAFYLQRDVSREDVRAEKERVFDHAGVIAVHAADPIIFLSEDGREAVMRFRKRYTIAGWDRWRRGEVLQELRWRRTRQGWKIVGERDLRVLAENDG